MSSSERDSVTNLTDGIARIATVFQAAQEKARRFLEALEQRIRGMDSVIRAVDQHLKDLNADGKFVERLQSDIEETESQLWKTFLRAAQFGWFLPAPPQVPVDDVFALHNALRDGNTALDDYMQQWIEGRIATIRTIITKRCPHRSEILNCVFEAHHSGQYNLSVPVFLAQADGIFLEWVYGSRLRETIPDKRSLYGKFGKRNQQRPVTAKLIDELETDPTVEAMVLKWLSPLSIVTALHADEEDMRDDLTGLLNRHAVIHGRSLDYGTKINSLKSISLLLFVVTLPTLNRPNSE